MKHTISVLVRNESGVLSRVSDLFSGRGYNIESLTVAPTLDSDYSRLTVITHGDDDVVEQITKQMESLFNNSKVSIVLNPESLGRVNIQLVNSPDGLSAQFTVASNEVRDLLMKGLDGLKDTLASHGVGIDNISIKVNDTQKEADNPEWTDHEGSRGGNKGQNQPDREEKEKGLFEKTIAKTINDNNQNIEI